MDINRHNQIEAYLSGQMTPDEISKFESMLEVNPELQQELAFQSEVINGIGTFRKNELKARLDSLDPSAAWWSIAQLTPVGQFIGGGVILGILGLGGYWMATQGEPNENSAIIIDAPPAPEFEPFTMVVSSDEEDEKPEEVELKAEIEEILEVTPKRKTNEIVEKEVAFNPVVTVPSAGNVEAESEFKPETLPAPDEVIEKPKTEAIDVEIIDSRASKIKYRYYAGKLFLYGNFENEPYEILEINSAKGRRVYLYHMGNFYGISQTDKQESLVEVTDKKLIKELSILRTSK